MECHEQFSNWRKPRKMGRRRAVRRTWVGGKGGIVVESKYSYYCTVVVHCGKVMTSFVVIEGRNLAV